MNFNSIEVVQGDITRITVDGIVNAGNNTLLGGGGVDGAIHRVAGYELLEECKTLNGCNVGQAKITKGYNLPSKYVIHTVGPVYSSDSSILCENLLRNCYKNSLILCDEYKIKRVSFPAISCGIYGYPIRDACRIAINEVLNFKSDVIEEVIFVGFNSDIVEYYEDALYEIQK